MAFIEADFRRIEEKIQHHKKMQTFYRNYMKAVMIVESFDGMERDLNESQAVFCEVGNCTQLISTHTSSKMCPSHEWKMARRAIDTERYLDD